MVINFTTFEKVKPSRLLHLSRGEGSRLSPESINTIIDECFRKIQHQERLEISHLNTLITFFDKIEKKSKEIFTNYLIEHLGKNEHEDISVISAFNELFPIPFLEIMFKSDFIQKSLTPQQVLSFNNFFMNKNPSLDSSAELIISFIEDLKITRNLGFTPGQIRLSAPYIKDSSFGLILEKKFERLIEFLLNIRTDAPSGIARFLDTQLGKRFIEDPDGIRVKALNESMGYYKYNTYVQKNNLTDSGLPNLKRLREIIIDLNHAIKILSEQEPRRGLFWQHILDHLDGLEIQKENSTTTYNVAVAFYITKYVFCDYGPTGNAIHIYERNIFDNKVKMQRDWKQVEHTTLALGVRKLSHTGNWEEDIKKLLLKARK